MGTRYLAGWEVDFKKSAEAIRFFKTQGVSKKGFDFFRKVQAGLELKLDSGNRIEKLYEHRDDGSEKELIEENIPLPILDWLDHDIFFMVKSKNGRHKIGGKKPHELKLPVNPVTKTTLQYIGTIDCKDFAFSWTEIKELHIIYPLYECTFGIYVDCNNPYAPTLIDPVFSTDDLGFSDMDVRATAEFIEARYSYTKKVKINRFIDDESSEIILCGVPLWYQQPEIPLCPVTGECMRYVCTINSDHELKFADNNLRQRLGEDECLSFGDYGHLFVFYHPTSKIMHVNAQW